MPAISAIIPAYNAARFIRVSIESVLSQTFEDFELVVVDDGSTDETREIVREYESDNRLVYTYQPNRGLPAARNTGIRTARGDLLAFLDSDDEWLPQKLELQYSVMQDPNVGACYGTALFVFPGGRVEEKRGRDWRSEDLFRRLMFENVLAGCTSSIMVRRECFDEVGLFDETLVSSEDRDMWMRIALNFNFRSIDAPLIKFDRTRTDNMSSNALRMAEGTLGVLANVESHAPERFRHLLPEVRRFHLLRVARYQRSAGNLRECRRYCLAALRSHRKPDKVTAEILALSAKSLIPTPVRLWYQRNYSKPAI